MENWFLDQRSRAFDHVFDAVVVTDLNGLIIDWNQGAERLYGYERAEIIGQPVNILYTPEDAERIGFEFHAAVERQKYWTGEIRKIHKNSSMGWIECFILPLYDELKQTVGTLAISRDITLRKQAENALRASEQRWRALLETSPDAIVIVDANGIILSINAHAENLFGYSRVELIGEKVDMLVPPEFRDFHGEYRKVYMQDPSTRKMGKQITIHACAKNGKLIPVEIGINAIPTSSGVWVMAIIHDLTVREQMNEQLRLLSAALEAVVNGVAISDTNGICLWVNPGFTDITGFSPEEIIGKPLSTLKSGLHDNAFYSNLWNTIKSGQPWHGEIINRHKDGHIYDEEQTIAPVRNAQGQITHYVAVKQNISERKQMENNLREANQKFQRQLNEIATLQEQLREQAIRDPLTGLYNRRYLTETLEREFSRARRQKQPISVAIMDIDLFKNVNDSFGHKGGDSVLVALARLLQSQIRASDIACRYGGEEFVFLMPGASVEHAAQRAEELRLAFMALEVPHDDARIIRCTISIGLATHPQHGKDGEAILLAADKALYQSKSNGRNRLTVYEG
jgi:diguanylate cyclase (GGDEF)-like protein/PAS domain S-box-containing protein